MADSDHRPRQALASLTLDRQRRWQAKDDDMVTVARHQAPEHTTAERPAAVQVNGGDGVALGEVTATAGWTAPEGTREPTPVPVVVLFDGSCRFAGIASAESPHGAVTPVGPVRRDRDTFWFDLDALDARGVTSVVVALTAGRRRERGRETTLGHLTSVYCHLDGGRWPIARAVLPAPGSHNGQLLGALVRQSDRWWFRAAGDVCDSMSLVGVACQYAQSVIGLPRDQSPLPGTGTNYLPTEPGLHEKGTGRTIRTEPVPSEQEVALGHG
jgi:hypothetical protein